MSVAVLNNITNYLARNKKVISVAVLLLVLIAVAFSVMNFRNQRVEERFTAAYSIASYKASIGKNSVAIKILQELFNDSVGIHRALSGLKLVSILSKADSCKEANSVAEVLINEIGELKRPALYYVYFYNSMMKCADFHKSEVEGRIHSDVIDLLKSKKNNEFEKATLKKFLINRAVFNGDLSDISKKDLMEIYNSTEVENSKKAKKKYGSIISLLP